MKNNDLYQQLINIINNESNTSKTLPPEETLAKQLGISRMKIRDILAEFESSGYITRKKGVGTLINNYALLETARLDIDNIYEDIISQSGFKPRSEIKKIKCNSEPLKDIIDNLSIDSYDSVYEIEKIIFADMKPVIYLIDYVPAKYFDASELDIRLLSKSTFCHIQNSVGESLQNSIMHLDVCNASNNLIDDLQVPENTPLLKLMSTCYNQQSVPIMYSIEYFNTKIIPFSFQKRIIRSKYKLI